MIIVSKQHNNITVSIWFTYTTAQFLPKKRMGLSLMWNEGNSESSTFIKKES